jgi:hypothetical protein
MIQSKRACCAYHIDFQDNKSIQSRLAITDQADEIGNRPAINYNKNT